MILRLSFPSSSSSGRPKVRKTPAPGNEAGSIDVGPGQASTMGHAIGEMTRIGVVGCPSRIASRKPCTAGTKLRSRKQSWLTTLMPSLSVIKSAG
jgi:hypothetical protein